LGLLPEGFTPCCKFALRTTNNMSNKPKIKFVGQPIFKQVISLIDAVQSVGRFIKIIEAKVHDKNFLKELDLISFSMVVFDRSYNYDHQYALWTSHSVYFVTRIKRNAV